MNIVCINGSPKGLKSNSHVMTRAILKGFESATSAIKNIFLSEKKINYCTGCYSCWFKTPGKCVIKDDMAEIIKVIKESTIIILATPLYFNNISGTLKVFFDRLTAMGGDPHKSRDSSNKEAASFIMVSNCGFPYRSQFDVISLWIKNVTKILQAKLIGEFYTTNGKVLTQFDNSQTDARNNYLDYLTRCGTCLFENGELSEELKASLNKGILEF
ncbi:MAG: flavodoxin family protein [Spirochaetales bacterium]|nr:flavodoxin family protein [Spirochaetales bacterium]